MPSEQERADDRVQTYSSSRWRRHFGIGLSIAAGAYAVALIAALPAAAIIRTPGPVTLSGTVWHGKAWLPGNAAVIWSANPLQSLIGLAFAADWTLRGPDSELSGRAKLRPHSIVLEKTTGQTGIGLVTGFLPEISLRCQGMARVDLRRVSLGRADIEADGEITTTPALCAQPGTDPRSIPPLLASLRTTDGLIRAKIAPQDSPDNGFATASLDPGGKLIAELRSDAGTIIPGLPQAAAGSGPFTLETTISLP